MPKFLYVGPHDAVDVLGQVVEQGAEIDVSSDAAKGLADQPDNWQPIKASSKKES